MTALPPHLAFALGGVIGIVSLGPIMRWIAGLRRATADQAEQPDSGRGDSRLLLLIFTTMHPAPWLLGLGVPFALYQLTLGPLPMMWLRLIAGVLIGLALGFLYETRIAGRPSR
jgi:hypothetical protein